MSLILICMPGFRRPVGTHGGQISADYSLIAIIIIQLKMPVNIVQTDRNCTSITSCYNSLIKDQDHE